MNIRLGEWCCYIAPARHDGRSVKIYLSLPGSDKFSTLCRCWNQMPAQITRPYAGLTESSTDVPSPFRICSKSIGKKTTIQRWISISL